MPSNDEPSIVTADAVSIETPCTGSSLVILNPRVFTILHPPKKVPNAMEVAARTATTVGTPKDGIQPTENNSAVITPIVFCASLVPWLRLTKAGRYQLYPSEIAVDDVYRHREECSDKRTHQRKGEHKSHDWRDDHEGQGLVEARPHSDPTPAFVIAAPTRPPINAWDELEGG